MVLVVSIPVLISHHRNSQKTAPAATGSAAPTPAATGPAPAPGARPPAPAPPRPGAPAAAIPAAGSGKTRTAAFVRPAPQREGRAVRVRVEVENELPFDVEAVAREAADVLQDRRSWTGRGTVHFDFVGDQPSDLTIYVITPETTDKHCRPLDTGGQVSCQNGRNVNLNALRWDQAVPDYRGDIPLYRQYLVNHEVGHFLGHGHVECPGPGQKAPVMQQQTKGLDGCLANPWP
ncbi:hypothetical protein GCM10028815_31120 [Mariniluteicoccus flavus]